MEKLTVISYQENITTNNPINPDTPNFYKCVTLKDNQGRIGKIIIFKDVKVAPQHWIEETYNRIAIGNKMIGKKIIEHNGDNIVVEEESRSNDIAISQFNKWKKWGLI